MLTMQERIEAYKKSEAGKKWPASVPHLGEDGRLYWIWVGGQNYRSKSGYYGSYPSNYLERVTALFPDCSDALHLFSGSLPPGPYTRFELNEELDADEYGDAQELSEHFYEDTFDVIYADPPYSEEDAKRYGTCLVNRNKVVKECAKVLKKDGFLVWLDQVLPMYRKDTFKVVGWIGFVRSTNHRFRVITIFQRV